MTLQLTDNLWSLKLDTFLDATHPQHLLGSFTSPFIVVNITSQQALSMWRKAGAIAQAITFESDTAYGEAKELTLNKYALLQFPLLSGDIYQLYYFPLLRLVNVQIKVWEYTGNTVDVSVSNLIQQLEASATFQVDFSSLDSNFVSIQQDLAAIKNYLSINNEQFNQGFLLDNLSTTVAYSLRRLRTNYTGAVIRVRRDSDNAEQNIFFTNNELDITSLNNFIGTGNGYVTTWYDQSGNGLNAIQTIISQQPKIINNLIQFEKANLNFLTANISSQAPPNNLMNIFFVAKANTNNSGGGFFKVDGSSTASGFALGQGNTNFDNVGNNLLYLRESLSWHSTSFTDIF